MHVENPRYHNELHDVFFEAAQQYGLKHNPDFNDWGTPQVSLGLRSNTTNTISLHILFAHAAPHKDNAVLSHNETGLPVARKMLLLFRTEACSKKFAIPEPWNPCCPERAQGSIHRLKSQSWVCLFVEL